MKSIKNFAKTLTNNATLLFRYQKMVSESQEIFSNPQVAIDRDMNVVDIGVLLLGCDQLDRQLFPPHPSGKTLLDMNNLMVKTCVELAEVWMKTENKILVDGELTDK